MCAKQPDLPSQPGLQDHGKGFNLWSRSPEGYISPDALLPGRGKMLRWPSPLRALWHSGLGTRTNLAPPQSLFYEYSCNLACGHTTSGCDLVSSPRQSGVRPGQLGAWESCGGKPRLLPGPWHLFARGARAMGCFSSGCPSLPWPDP